MDRYAVSRSGNRHAGVAARLEGDRSAREFDLRTGCLPTADLREKKREEERKKWNIPTTPPRASSNQPNAANVPLRLPSGGGRGRGFGDHVIVRSVGARDDLDLIGQTGLGRDAIRR